MEKVKRILVSTLILIMALSFGMVGSQTDASAKKAKKVTISLNKKKHTLQIGKTLKLKAKVKPAKKKKNVTFKSSNKKIASVSKKGVVKGKKKGKEKRESNDNRKNQGNKEKGNMQDHCHQKEDAGTKTDAAAACRYNSSGKCCDH